jgi:predicted GH43/DUF377 family glycosyl hydrolase
LARSDKPVFGPELEWERVGQVPNVVFVEGAVLDGKRWLFYYGAADKSIGVATAPVRWFDARGKLRASNFIAP